MRCTVMLGGFIVLSACSGQGGGPRGDSTARSEPAGVTDAAAAPTGAAETADAAAGSPGPGATAPVEAPYVPPADARRGERLGDVLAGVVVVKVWQDARVPSGLWRMVETNDPKEIAVLLAALGEDQRTFVPAPPCRSSLVLELRGPERLIAYLAVCGTVRPGAAGAMRLPDEKYRDGLVVADPGRILALLADRLAAAEPKHSDAARHSLERDFPHR